MAKVYKNQRRKSRKINTPNYLPFEIIENILSRLPVKSLLRFKAVSKPWYSLISDSKFARVHLQHSVLKSTNNTISVFSPDLVHRDALFKLTNQSFEIESLKFPMKSYCEELCSSEGLVLLGNTMYTKTTLWNPSTGAWSRNTMYTKFVLWNPSTRAYTEFSSPYKYFGEFKRFGLCYDAANDDYKVVCLYNKKLDIPKPVVTYVIYSLKDNSWTEKKETCIEGWITNGSGIFVSGVVHWVVKYEYCKCSEDGTKDIYEICCFDPSDGKLKKLSSTPTSFDLPSLFELVPIKGQLSISQYFHKIAMLEIWTMKEYGNCNSWTKLIKLENLPVGRDLCNCTFFLVKLLCLTKEGNYVLQIYKTNFKPIIVIYSSKEDKFEETSSLKKRRNTNDFSDEEDNDSDCLEEQMRCFARVCWNDSLVLPKRINKDD